MRSGLTWHIFRKGRKYLQVRKSKNNKGVCVCVCDNEKVYY